MKRVETSEIFLTLLSSAKSLAVENEVSAILLLAELPYDFKEIDKKISKCRLIVASDKPDIQRAAKEDEIDLVPLLDEPQTRQLQVSQALLEAIADDLLKSGDTVVAMYSVYERNYIDSISLIILTEHLAKLTARDLRRLETQVPLETLRLVVDLAIDIGREGREGKPVGTMFVVGNHRKVMGLSHEGVHDPFKGYSPKERMIRNPRVRESIKELAIIDGAFVISADGVAQGAGRILNAPAAGITLSKGLGARHWMAAAISKSTKAISITVSESTGTVRIFQNGMVMLRIEPLDSAMIWHEFETEPTIVE